MRYAEHYVRGTVTLTVRGAFPERLLNLCAQERAPCWGVEWVDGALRLTTYRRRLRQVRQLARRAGCEIAVEGRWGLPDFLGRFRRRYAFLIGLALSLLAVCVLSRFVLTIEVSGNEQVSTARILSQLQREGVRPGVYGPGLDRKAIAHRVLLELEELSWMSINLYGTRLDTQAAYMPYSMESDVSQLASLLVSRRGKTGSIASSNEIVHWQAGGTLTFSMDYPRVLASMLVDLGSSECASSFTLEASADGKAWLLNADGTRSNYYVSSTGKDARFDQYYPAAGAAGSSGFELIHY